MSDYQQPQAGHEWRDQEDEYWFAKNSEQASTEAEKHIMDQLLAQFDSVFGQSEENI